MTVKHSDLSIGDRVERTVRWKWASKGVTLHRGLLGTVTKLTEGRIGVEWDDHDEEQWGVSPTAIKLLPNVPHPALHVYADDPRVGTKIDVSELKPGDLFAPYYSEIGSPSVIGRPDKEVYCAVQRHGGPELMATRLNSHGTVAWPDNGEENFHGSPPKTTSTLWSRGVYYSGRS